MKNVLLIVTGASPQVLTETLFALYQQGKPMPEEVFVITTKSTKAMLTNGLFKQGHLAKLIADYKLPNIKLPDENIWLIEDDKGQPIDDAKSEIEQIFQSEFIFTAQEAKALGIKRRFIYKGIQIAQHYAEIQNFLKDKAANIDLNHRIYFDLVWNKRYESNGTNLFLANPSRNS